MAAFFSLAISSGCGVGVRESTIVNKVLARSATSNRLAWRSRLVQGFAYAANNTQCHKRLTGKGYYSSFPT